MDKKTFLQVSAVMVVCAVIFSVLILALTKTEKLTGVSVPKDDVIYEPSVDYPKDTVLFMTFEDGYSLCLKLQFENNFITAFFLEDNSEKTAENYGFHPDKTLHCSYSFIMNFIDTLGGINLDIFGEELRYTGVQICNVISVNKDSIKTKVSILKAVFNKIYKTGFSNELLSCIMNNTENSLSVPDCYGWTEFLGNMCNRYNIINGG